MISNRDFYGLVKRGKCIKLEDFKSPFFVFIYLCLFRRLMWLCGYVVMWLCGYVKLWETMVARCSVAVSCGGGGGYGAN